MALCFDDTPLSSHTRGPDRRSRIRFEIVGRLRGTVVAQEEVELQNISRGGALILASRPVPLDSLYTVRLQSDAVLDTLEARVRHVRRTPDDRYLIGLEFVQPDPHLSAHLDRLVSLPYPPSSGV
jgi:PilZ domain